MQRRRDPQNVARRRFAFAVLFLGAALVAVLVRHQLGVMRPQGIVLHHSALGSHAADRAATAATIDAIHAERGWGVTYEGRTYHIGYHYVIRYDGTIEAGRPERVHGAHAPRHNDYIGICILGNFSSHSHAPGERVVPPTPAQMASLERLCRRLMRTYRIPPERIVRHRDVKPSTECPGDRFPYEKLMGRLRIKR